MHTSSPSALQVSPNFDPNGVAMISVALVADAVIGNMQEKGMREYGASGAEVIRYSYSIGLVYLLLFLLLTDSFFSGAQLFREDPLRLYGSAFLFSGAGYFGMQVVLTMVRRFGALLAVTVTSCRKVLSVVLSFLAFAKPFSVSYVYGGILVLLGVYLNVLGKRHRDKDWRTMFVTFLTTAQQSRLAFRKRGATSEGISTHRSVTGL